MAPAKCMFLFCGLTVFAALGQSGCAGCGPRVLVAVELHTDLAPWHDFDEIEVRLGNETHLETPSAESYLRPARIAEMLIAPTASEVVQVELRLRGRWVASGRMLGRFVRSTSVRIPIQARCRGVRCGDEQVCVDRVCVDLDSICEGEPCDPETCGGACAGTCGETADCSASDDGCSDLVCSGRVCLATPRPDACPPELRCSVGVGCVEVVGILDAGVRGDAGPEAGTTGPNGDAGEASDGGIEHCRTCMTECGTVGLERCIDGDPQGVCDPPVDLCNGRDDDCDGTFDEDAPAGCTGSHSHGVIFRVGDAETAVDHVAGGGRGLVCGGGSCATSITAAQTMRGPDGHTHAVTLGGSSSLSFPDNVFVATGASAGPASSGTAHSHAITCGIGDGGREIAGASFAHEVLDVTDLDRYDHFCAPPARTGPCRDHFGYCTAR